MKDRKKGKKEMKGNVAKDAEKSFHIRREY